MTEYETESLQDMQPATTGNQSLTEVDERSIERIVGIGASAGGLEALELFFNHMAPNSGFTFVIVQHLSPDYKSLMAQILAKHTEMVIREAEHDMRLLPNHVYLMPSRTNMTIEKGRLKLFDKKPETGLNLPIDMFFRSLAEDQRETAIGIILSGTGSDGSRGIKAIKEAGGLVYAQSQETAKFDGMPISAIQTGVVDHICSPEQMADSLLELSKQWATQPSVSSEPTEITTDQYIQLIFDRIKQVCGIDFSYYKRNSMLRRIERRMSIHKLKTIADYMSYIREHAEEAHGLRKDLLIGVTNFFRDAEAFQIIYDRVLPTLFENKKKDREIRVWVAGCSTGEEAYSIAILLRKYADTLNEPYHIKIFATDLDKEAIEYAGQGVYSQTINNHLSEEDINRFFIPDEGMYRISKDIRKMIVFAPHNIIKDPPFSNLDLITCRNMLIYLQSEIQLKVISLFHFALNPEGFLFLGPSETVGRYMNQFEPLDRRWNIFNHKSGRSTNDKRLFEMNGKIAHNIAGRKTDAAFTLGRSRVESKSSEALHLTLTEEHIAPGIVVDGNNEIVLLNGEVNEYLTLAKGKPSWNLYKMLDASLSVAISTAMLKVRKEQKQTLYRTLKVKTMSGDKIINLRALPFSTKHKAYDKHVLVLFEEADSSEPITPTVLPPPDAETNSNYRIQELERELRQVEETLQATVEELETSNEELQATNEELVASNEELQSTNEELQSVNEELVTVNTEFQFKIQELTDVNNDMSNFLVSTRIGTIFLDKRLCIRRFTPAVTKEINLLEIDHGRPIGHISHNFKYDMMVEDAATVLRTLEPVEREIQNKQGDWYSMRILPYRTDDHFVNGVVLTFVDITDLKSVNEELVKLSYAIEQSPSIVVITNLEGIIEYINPQFTEATGYRTDIVRRTKLKDLILWDSHEEHYDLISHKVHSGEMWRGELQVLTSSEDLIWASIKFVPIKNREGQIIHFLMLAENISERKNSEELLRKTEMLSAVGQLAAGIAHEIRNPLTALKGFTKLMSTGRGNKEGYVAIMLDELNRIEEIVSELLVLAKPQAVDFTDKPLEPILRDVMLLLDTQAIMNDVEVKMQVEPGLPAVSCVDNQLKQVFINLLKNAIEAMTSGGIIEVLAKRFGEDKIMIQFKDNGPGISESKLAKLGEPFYSTKEKGTGLGLMVSYKIIENHDGTIGFESEEGAGTTVTVTLPAS